MYHHSQLGPQVNSYSSSGVNSNGIMNGSSSPDTLLHSNYPYANSFLNAVHHLHQQTNLLQTSPNDANNNNNNNNNSNPSSSSSSSSSSTSSSSNVSLLPVNSSTPNLAQSAVAAAAAAAAAAALQQQQQQQQHSSSSASGANNHYLLNSAQMSLNESQYSSSSIPSPHSPKSAAKSKLYS